jgi:CBS domain-containing protein
MALDRPAIPPARPRRRRRLLTRRSVRESLVSLSELRALQLLSSDHRALGPLSDVVVRWDGTDPYPPVTGVLVRLGERDVFVATGEVERIGYNGLPLRVEPEALGDFARRDGELCLVADVLGRQLVDVDGVKVLRAEELYLASVLGRLRLVAVSGRRGHRLARRRGPKRALASTRAARLVDWAAVHPFGEPGSQLRLQLPHEGLRKLRAGELADLLEGLDRHARDELTASLDRAAVADALEEMEPESIEALLRDSSPGKAVELLAAMEPDEAADALRDLERAEADAILAAMPADRARQLTEILGYPETMAGGFMTTTLLRATPGDTVAEVRSRLAAGDERSTDIDGVVVVDEGGRCLGDIGVLELFLADPATELAALLGEASPVTLAPDAFLDEVVDRLTEARRRSVVVVDGDGRPIGRVLADDVLDALKEGGLRLRLPWLLH